MGISTWVLMHPYLFVTIILYFFLNFLAFFYYSREKRGSRAIDKVILLFCGSLIYLFVFFMVYSEDFVWWFEKVFLPKRYEEDLEKEQEENQDRSG